MSYEIQLAREILATKFVQYIPYIHIDSEDTRFVRYKDDYIEIIAGEHTKALHIEIYSPLTTAGSNPIIYVNDEGHCYRNHGERGYFIMYAERLLDKEITIGAYERNIEKQKEIDALLLPK